METCACGCGETFERKGGTGGKRRRFIDRRHAGRYHTRLHRERHPELHTGGTRKQYFRAWQLKRFGLTVSQYDELLAAQGGVCAVCKEPPAAGRQLAVDHDHSCCPDLHACDGCRRGLLCTKCNQLLGLIDDDPQYLARLLAYLDRK